MKIYFFLLSAFIVMGLPRPAQADKDARALYLQRIRADIDDMVKQLHGLERENARVAKDDKEEFQKEVRALWKKERLARVQLEKLEHVSENQWKKLRAAEDSTVIHLKKSYRYTVNHFLKEHS